MIFSVGLNGILGLANISRGGQWVHYTWYQSQRLGSDIFSYLDLMGDLVMMVKFYVDSMAPRRKGVQNEGISGTSEVAQEDTLTPPLVTQRGRVPKRSRRGGPGISNP